MEKSTMPSKRTAILDAANRVLLKKGADEFTLDAVAREAAVSKGGLLYHFPSKNRLIQAMIERNIERVETTLREELEKSGGDYLCAYIRASFKTTTEPEQISRALFAAISNDITLLEPLKAHFFKMQNEIAEAAPSPEIGTLIRLSLDGLWFSELFGYAPPSPDLKAKMQETLLEYVQKKHWPANKK
jgi:AcrR family transcriptional regulator